MTEIAKVYGQSLYELAVDESLAEEFRRQLTALKQIFSEMPEYFRLLSTPSISKQERCRLLDDALRDSVHIYILNFLKILTEKGYIRQLFGCMDAFFDLYNQDNGILPVTAVTAVALSAEQSERLAQKLSRITGKTIDLRSRIDPAVYGGVRLDYDGKRLDDTISHRLDAIRDLLNKTVL
jgi:F-type H+-transporting ATPase subunit delta